jgi:hypothetical protein
MLEKLLDDERRSDTRWCKCGNCTTRHHAWPRSLYCCDEMKNSGTRYGCKFDAKMDQIDCISEHPEFLRLALDETVCVEVPSNAAYSAANTSNAPYFRS